MSEVGGPDLTRPRRPGAGRLDPDQRRRDLARLATETFDVLVVGGGVTGAGAALDAATRGLSVALVEARDWAAGTSGRSSRLVHGGLRYLEQRDLGLVREALTERGLMLARLAPHLVRPVPFVLPLHRHVWARMYYGAGVALYDVLGRVLWSESARGLPRHRHLTRSAALRRFPALRPDRLVGAIEYFDAQVDDARHTLTVARTAARYGACLVSSARVTGLLRDGGRVVGARVHDLEADRPIRVRARVVLAATGVWSDDVERMLGADTGLAVRASKGVHLVLSRDRLDGHTGLILRTEPSVLFVIPWERYWIVGTTDTDWRLDRTHPAASAADVEHILGNLNQVLSTPLTSADVHGVYAGLRPLLAGASPVTSMLSREHAVVRPAPGLVLVAGGKYTTYRVMAADAVDAACRWLPWAPASRTRHLPLLGAHQFARAWQERDQAARRYDLPVAVVEHLLRRYGDRTVELLDLVRDRPDLGRPLVGAPEYLAVEAFYAAHAEGALHLEDILVRRTRISVETAHRGVDSAEAVANLVAPVLGWDGARVEREVRYYRLRVAAERESQRMPDDRTAELTRLTAPDIRRPTPDVFA